MYEMPQNRNLQPATFIPFGFLASDIIPAEMTLKFRPRSQAVQFAIDLRVYP